MDEFLGEIGNEYYDLLWEEYMIIMSHVEISSVWHTPYLALDFRRMGRLYDLMVSHVALDFLACETITGRRKRELFLLYRGKSDA